jgi:nitrogen fixation protein FixH
MSGQQNIEERNSPWRWFPVASLAALGVVVLINTGMIYAALHTFPGNSADDGFDASNRYDRVLDAAAQKAALGWSVDAKAEGNRAAVHVVGKDGQAMPNARVTATARRPLGPPMATELTFDEQPNSIWRAESALPQPGQWDLTIKVVNSADAMTFTRRILVK